MSIQSKPDYKVFASDAKSGEIETFPDILRGWGVTIDRTGEIPPMEWFNAIGKRVDEWLMYLTQRGVAEWDASIDYPKTAVVTHRDVIYISLRASNGERPSTTQASWSTLDVFLKLGDYATKTELNNGLNAKLDKTSIVQSTGSSTTQVMSQDATTKTLSMYATKESLELVAVPIGASILWNTSTSTPENFWANEGRTFSASEYPELAKIFTNLRLPDDRGYAIRAADNGRGIDPGRTVGTYQEDAMQRIQGKVENASSALFWTGDPSATGAFKRTSNTGAHVNSPTKSEGHSRGLEIDSSLVTRTASETRMKNVAKILITRVK